MPLQRGEGAHEPWTHVSHSAARAGPPVSRAPVIEGASVKVPGQLEDKVGCQDTYPTARVTQSSADRSGVLMIRPEDVSDLARRSRELARPAEGDPFLEGK